MNVSTLVDFLRKASLDGYIEAIILEFKDGLLSCRSVPQNKFKTVVVELSWKFSDCQSMKVGIRSSEAIGCFAAFKENAESRMYLDTNKNVDPVIFPNAKCLVVQTVDEKEEAAVPVIPSDMIKEPSQLKGLPDLSLSVPFNCELADHFRKMGKEKFGDWITFQRKNEELFLTHGKFVRNEKNKVNGVMSLEYWGSLDRLKEPVSFSAPILKRVLKVTSEIDSPILEIEPKGVARFDFSDIGQKTVFWLSAIKD